MWGDEQWQALLAVVVERNPRVICIDRSTVLEDAIVAADGNVRWALRRQDELFLVR